MQIFLRQYYLNLPQIYKITTTRANIFARVGSVFNYFYLFIPLNRVICDIFQTHHKRPNGFIATDYSLFLKMNGEIIEAMICTTLFNVSFFVIRC